MKYWKGLSQRRFRWIAITKQEQAYTAVMYYDQLKPLKVETMEQWQSNPPGFQYPRTSIRVSLFVGTA